jgi:hypothetical protein
MIFIAHVVSLMHIIQPESICFVEEGCIGRKLVIYVQLNHFKLDLIIWSFLCECMGPFENDIDVILKKFN